MIVLTSKIIRIAFELFDYIDSIDRIYFFNTSTEVIVNSIVINFFKSTSLSITNHSISINIVYSAKWIVDRTRFRKDIRNFVIVIETYRNSQQFFDWINVDSTSIISDLNLSIANTFRFKFFEHFFDQLNERSQITSSSSSSRRRNNIIISLNIISRNTKNIEFTFAFNSNMSNENNNWQNIEFTQQ